MNLAESLMDGVIAFVLDPAADEKFGGVGEFCMETWKPELTISLDASGEATLAAVGETISPFWDLRQVYR